MGKGNDAFLLTDQGPDQQVPERARSSFSSCGSRRFATVPPSSHLHFHQILGHSVSLRLPRAVLPLAMMLVAFLLFSLPPLTNDRNTTFHFALTMMQFERTTPPTTSLDLTRGNCSVPFLLSAFGDCRSRKSPKFALPWMQDPLLHEIFRIGNLGDQSTREFRGDRRVLMQSCSEAKAKAWLW